MEDDKNNLCELQECNRRAGFTNIPKTSEVPSKNDYSWKIFNTIFMIAVIFLLISNLIIGAIIVYDVRNKPQECDTTTTTTTGAVTGGVTPNITYILQDNRTQVEMLQQIKNITEQILFFVNTQSDYIENNTDSIGDTLDIVRDSAVTLDDVVGTLSGIKDNGIITEATVNDVHLLVDQLLKLQNSTYQTEPTSCQDLINRHPSSTSGYYHINSQIVYCEIGELCDTEGGWTRIAYLDMSDSTVDCPDVLRYYQSGSVRACGRDSVSNGSCESLKFSTYGVSYTEVCGRIVGYQYGSTDGLRPHTFTIDSYYVDGISITQGYPRTHIWTLASGLHDSYTALSNCPCNNPPGFVHNKLDDFIGDHYFCESGNPNDLFSLSFYSSDPLWDGEGCGTQETNCCSVSGLPWFHRNDLNASTELIELRICGDSGIEDEDTPISYYEIYVK